MTDFNDPASRLELIERVGHEAYNAALNKWIADSRVAVVNGYAIRPVQSRFGRLFSVDGTGSAYLTQQAAEQFAAEQSDPGPLAAIDMESHPGPGLR